MITLRIFVMGLVALLPTQGHDGRKGLTLVVPDSDDHVPVIVFPTTEKDKYRVATHDAACSLDIARNLADGLLDNGCKGCAAIRLKSSSITILDLAPGSLTFAGGRKCRIRDLLGAVPRTRAEARDFSWVAGMDDMAGHHAALKPHYSDPGNPQGRAALLVISDSEGSVEASHMAEVWEPSDGCNGRERVDPNPWPSGQECKPPTSVQQVATQAAPEWFMAAVGDQAVIRPLSFKHGYFPIGSPRRAVADEVLIELRVNADKVTLKLDDSTTISLDPENGVVEVLIANLTPLPCQRDPDQCSPQIQKTWPTKLPDMSCKINVAHLGHFYDLADNPGSGQAVDFGMDFVRVTAGQVNRTQEETPRVILAVSPKAGSIHGGVGRPICMSAVYGQ